MTLDRTVPLLQSCFLNYRMKIITLTLASAKKQKRGKVSARQVVSAQQTVVIVLLLVLLPRGKSRMSCKRKEFG